MRVQEIEKLNNVQMMIKNNELIFTERKVNVSDIIKYLNQDKNTWRKMADTAKNKVTSSYFEGKANEAESLLLRIV